MDPKMTRTPPFRCPKIHRARYRFLVQLSPSYGTHCRKYPPLHHQWPTYSLHWIECLIHGTTGMCGPGSSVGIATELRAGRSGIESQWGRDFPPVQTGPGAYPTSCKMGTGSFPGVKCGRGVLLNTHPLLVPHSWKSRAIPLPTLWATPGL